MTQNILLVEDNPPDAKLVTMALTSFESVEVIHVDTIAAARSQLLDPNVEIGLVLLDLLLPDSKGPTDTVRRISQASVDIPIIAMTALDLGEESQLDIELVLADVVDLVEKESMTADSIRNVVVDGLRQRRQILSDKSGIHRQLVNIRSVLDTIARREKKVNESHEFIFGNGSMGFKRKWEMIEWAVKWLLPSGGAAIILWQIIQSFI